MPRPKSVRFPSRFRLFSVRCEFVCTSTEPDRGVGIVKVADEVPEELRKDRSLSEIRTKFKSASPIAQGCGHFWPRQTA
jgi:hypothetical protein